MTDTVEQLRQRGLEGVCLINELGVVYSASAGATGAGTATAATRVTLASNDPLVALGGSGLAIVGNRVSSGHNVSTLAYSQTSYSTGVCIGGKFQITGLPASTTLQELTVRFKKEGTVWTSATCGLLLCNADPGSSTLADNSSTAIVAGDMPKVIAALTAAPTAPGGYVQANFTFTRNAGYRIPVDTGGTLWCALTSLGSNSFSASGNLYVSVDWAY